MEIKIVKYSRRYWAIYRNGELLAVTVYKKGATAIRDALTETIQFKPVAQAITDLKQLWSAN